MITALLPPGQLQPGSYVLRVIDPPLGRQGRSNLFEVTLGEVGPAGAPGTNGVDGVNGVNGLPGPAGANCYDGIGTSVAVCQGASGPTGPAGDAIVADPPCFDDSNRYVDCNNGTVTDQ